MTTLFLSLVRHATLCIVVSRRNEAKRGRYVTLGHAGSITVRLALEGFYQPEDGILRERLIIMLFSSHFCRQKGFSYQQVFSLS